MSSIVNYVNKREVKELTEILYNLLQCSTPSAMIKSKSDICTQEEKKAVLIEQRINQ